MCSGMVKSAVSTQDQRAPHHLLPTYRHSTLTYVHTSLCTIRQFYTIRSVNTIKTMCVIMAICNHRDLCTISTTTTSQPSVCSRITDVSLMSMKNVRFCWFCQHAQPAQCTTGRTNVAGRTSLATKFLNLRGSQTT